MKRALLVALATCVLLVMSPLARASADVVSVTVEGMGADLRDATSNALVEAIRQVNGVSIDANQVMQTTTVSAMASDAQGNTSSFTATQQQGGSVAASSAGHLAGYQVLESGPSEYGYRVVLEARIHRYRTPGIDTGNRRRLALIPFGSRVGQVDFFGPMRGSELAHDLSQAMQAQLVQSRRFAILDRDSWGAVERERALLASSSTPIAEKAKLGQALGADYLLLGEVLEAGGGHYSSVERLTGVARHGSGASLAVAFRIVVPATGEIRFADTIEVNVGDQAGAGPGSRMAALNELARNLMGITLDRIYPMQVVSASATGEVVLNQGGSTLAIGDRLVLVEQGERLRDPYTNESLGRAETVIGQLEITRVDGRVSYARLAEGSTGVARVGQLARRPAAGTAMEAASAVPPPTPRTTGVRLPFDR